jgi:uncharacterized membrane protein
MLNSVAWSVAATAALIAAVRRYYDFATALIAGALFAFSPAALFYGDQVRMYSLLMLLIIWVWVAQKEWLRAAEERRARAKLSLNLIASELAVIYTHSAGLVMISGCVLLAAATLIGRRDIVAGRRWVLCQSAVVLCALPAVAIALFREVGHSRVPSLTDIATTWEFLAAGALQGTALGVALAIALLAALAWLFAVAPRERIAIATLVFGPLLLGALISYGLKPIWLKRLFVTIIPFLCLFAALAIRKLTVVSWRDARLRAALALVLAVAWIGTGVASQFAREKGDGFKPAADYLREKLAPHDVVLVTRDYFYWCFLWYFAGPDWGVPQQAYMETPKWANFVSHLDPRIVSALDFREQKRDVKVRGADVIMWDRRNPIPAASTIFVLRDATIDERPVIPGYDLIVTRQKQNLLIDEFRKTTAN